MSAQRTSFTAQANAVQSILDSILPSAKIRDAERKLLTQQLSDARDTLLVVVRKDAERKAGAGHA